MTEMVDTCFQRLTEGVAALKQTHLTTNYGRISKNINPLIRGFARTHVDSFNYFLSEGLTRAVRSIPPVEFVLSNKLKTRVSLAFRDASVGIPTVSTAVNASNMRMYPSECRLKGTTYRSKLTVKVTWSVNDAVQSLIERCVGEIPIMVMSDRCNLKEMTPKELVQHGEESQEFGGYFVVNGYERLIRMFIVQRRNYPLCMVRTKWRSRGKLFSEYGVMVRCVAADQSATNNVLHYLTNGIAKLMFSYRSEMFYMPVALILKALSHYTDREIFSELIKGREGDTYYKSCIAYMLRQIQDENLYSHEQILAYIGEKFRNKLNIADWYTNAQVAEFLLKHCVCIHLDNNQDKFNFLVFMTKKLFAAVNGECALESPDNPMNNEVLLAGHLYLMFVKEKLMMWLSQVRFGIEKKAKAAGEGFILNSQIMVSSMSSASDLTRSTENMLCTGNFSSQTGNSLMQTSGFTILAEKLNYLRYVSHFRSVHRGTFFTTMRTTVARKLLPESWGFICPVHTPDGVPCGLLNHLTALCEVVAYQAPTTSLSALLCSFGMIPYDAPLAASCKDSYIVFLDGRILGYLPKHLGLHAATKLRLLKASSDQRVPAQMEICLIPITGKASQYPGLYLFTTPARMMRPVLNLSTGTTEYIGTFEQAYLNVSVTAEEIYPQITTHLELKENSMLSFSANLIPMSDFNQSPRNMYQCQMAKQTMGTPAHTLRYRCDNKLYRILTPQSPLFRPSAYDDYQIDDYPLGTNAIVAVISYTGYDMEDAMIINKASLDRGFAHGVVYKNDVIDLLGGKTVTRYFGRQTGNNHMYGHLGVDGLPEIGSFLQNEDPFYSTVDVSTGEVKVMPYKSLENAIVEDVLLFGGDSNKLDFQKACIRLRIPRNPTIGDKFASRHGQKGICSHKWPQENMPFTESGMTPDIIFNPHGFPSRMTIGMMIESMAGKSASLHGLVHDASPFKFSEDDSAVDYFGKMLESAGYNYYGTERMYSGVDGRELNADIFFGVVYYQRLRHMVADKYQVRTTGPVDILTKQPVKGRKRAGGIRFGEMERDSLLAHGVSLLLHDRLFNCSDRSLDYVCTKCGSLVSPIFLPPKQSTIRDTPNVWTCSICETSEYVQMISLPYVFHYLVAELASVNVRAILKIK